jgi:hypothetical protein
MQIKLIQTGLISYLSTTAELPRAAKNSAQEKLINDKYM